MSLLDNLYVKVDKNTAFKVIAFVESRLADDIKEGAVIDTVGDTAVIASLSSTKLGGTDWFYANLANLQMGHQFIRID